MVDGDVLGQINFQAPLESDGTDSILVGASIWAEADDTFSTTVNSTELVFATGASETATEKMRITSDGNVGIGSTAPAYALDVVGDARVGWHGSSTRVKILPSDFISNDDDADNQEVFEDDEDGTGVRNTAAGSELYAFVTIPTGYTATHARVYGTGTETCTVYESEITDGALSTSLGSDDTGTEIDITDTASTTTNFLVIKVSTNGTDDILFGGYVTITPS